MPPFIFGGESDSWTYDAIGNRLTTTVNGVPTAYTYLKNGSNPLNGQRLSNDGVNAYTWDANGSNLTRNGAPGNFTFGYDPDNRLTGITGAATASYTYDYQGRRTSKTVGGVTTTYLYDGLNLVGETSGATTATYVFGPGIDEPLAQYRAGTLSYFAADGLGTISVTNNPAGSATLSTSFDAWGVARNETGTRLYPFTYTGRKVGEAGLLFYRARYYQPAVGRFTQEDPLGLADGPSIYAYVSNLPSDYRDPSGRQVADCDDPPATTDFSVPKSCKAGPPRTVFTGTRKIREYNKWDPSPISEHPSIPTIYSDIPLPTCWCHWDFVARYRTLQPFRICARTIHCCPGGDSVQMWEIRGKPFDVRVPTIRPPEAPRTPGVWVDGACRYCQEPP